VHSDNIKAEVHEDLVESEYCMKIVQRKLMKFLEKRMVVMGVRRM
jgi:hypothetical protein